MPIWLVFSWLIRQIESVIEPDKDPEGNETELKDMEELGIEVEVDPFEPVVQVIKIEIAAFSVLLLGLSISAYRKTTLKGIIYAAIAFGLFAVQLFFEYFEDAIEDWERAYNDVIFYAMTRHTRTVLFCSDKADQDLEILFQRDCNCCCCSGKAAVGNVRVVW